MRGFCKGMAIGDDLADLELYARENVTLQGDGARSGHQFCTRADFVTQRGGGEEVIVELAR